VSSPNAASTTAILLWQTNIAVGEASSAVSAEYRIHRGLSLEHLRTPQLQGTFRLESIDEADTVGCCTCGHFRPFYVSLFLRPCSSDGLAWR
jgi:hypothetical protein